MGLFILSETSAGYVLLKSKDKKLLGADSKESSDIVEQLKLKLLTVIVHYRDKIASEFLAHILPPACNVTLFYPIAADKSIANYNSLQLLAVVSRTQILQ